jgi:hypothetical protein
LLARLVEAGAASTAPDVDEQNERRRDAIRQVAGSMSGTHEPAYVTDLRDDWPQ